MQKRDKKHYCWGLCNSDSRYANRFRGYIFPVLRVFFLRFVKPGRVKGNMTSWQKEQEKQKTEKAKRWLQACGRKDFSGISDIKKDIFICSLHFVGET